MDYTLVLTLCIECLPNELINKEIIFVNKECYKYRDEIRKRYQPISITKITNNILNHEKNNNYYKLLNKTNKTTNSDLFTLDINRQQFSLISLLTYPNLKYLELDTWNIVIPVHENIVTKLNNSNHEILKYIQPIFKIIKLNKFTEESNNNYNILEINIDKYTKFTNNNREISLDTLMLNSSNLMGMNQCWGYQYKSISKKIKYDKITIQFELRYQNISISELGLVSFHAKKIHFQNLKDNTDLLEEKYTFIT